MASDGAQPRRDGDEASVNLIPVERIDNAILEIRGERVMIDYDLAAIYGVTTKALN